MAMVRMTLDPGRELTPEELAMLEEMDRAPVVYDEDCPKLTEEQLRQFRPVNPEARAKWLAAKNRATA